MMVSLARVRIVVAHTHCFPANVYVVRLIDLFYVSGGGVKLRSFVWTLLCALSYQHAYSTRRCRIDLHHAYSTLQHARCRINARVGIRKISGTTGTDAVDYIFKVPAASGGRCFVEYLPSQEDQGRRVLRPAEAWMSCNVTDEDVDRSSPIRTIKVSARKNRLH